MNLDLLKPSKLAINKYMKKEKSVKMYKTKLREMCQQKRWGLPLYSSLKDGPDHDPRFKACVSFSGHSFRSSVSCKSSKDAQNNAAMVAFLHFTSPRTPSDLMTSAEPTAGELNIGETSQGPEKHTKAPDVQCQYKSQLQNYAQRKNIDSPSYTCIREGPAHTPCFKATVTVDGHCFESPNLYKSKKAAEHAAANVALMSLSINEVDCCFYKSLLQELTQREDLSKPVYKTIKSGAPHMSTFFSTVEVESEVFYGDAGRSKKEAEIKAAKVAYTCFIWRLRNGNIGQIVGDVKPTVSSELVINVNSQNLEQNLSPGIKHAEASKEIVLANAKTSSDVKPFMDDVTGNHDTAISCHMPASVQGSSLSSPLMTHAAPLISDSSIGRATGTTSYLLCNRVRVYSCFPDISFPRGITVLPISENRWVTVSLEFPNEQTR